MASIAGSTNRVSDGAHINHRPEERFPEPVEGHLSGEPAATRHTHTTPKRDYNQPIQPASKAPRQKKDFTKCPS